MWLRSLRAAPEGGLTLAQVFVLRAPVSRLWGMEGATRTRTEIEPGPTAELRRDRLLVPVGVRVGELARPIAGDAARLAAVPPETEDLVHRAQGGDRAAFAELFRRHRGDVGRLVFRMVGHSPDAEDIVQEVFLQVHKSLGEFRGQAKFTTWLHRVTVNVVLMMRRAAKSRPVFAGEPATDCEPDRRLLPDEDAARLQRLVAFRRLLARLAEKKRTVFVLHELEGLSPSEIASIVDAPVLTVRTRLFYARRELAEMMKEEPTLAQLAQELAGESSSRGRTTPVEAHEAGVETEAP